MGYLKVKFSGWNRISVERVVSGKGICNIYEFLAYKSPKRVDKKVHKQFLESQGNAGVIAANASKGSLCAEALDIFASCYGAQCGTVAIHFMPFRGLFITGGVSNKLEHLIKDPDGRFMGAYYDKGRVAPLLDQVPLLLVRSEDMGQRGAHLRSVRLLQEHLDGVASRIADDVSVGTVSLVAPREKAYGDDDPTGLTEASLQQTINEFQSNRRRLVEKGEEYDHEPIFKSELWRMKRAGNRMNPDDWIWREMWITRNGSLAYQFWNTSLGTKSDMVYATREDLEKATIEVIPNADCGRPWGFQVKIPGFRPAIFAGESSAARDYWVAQLHAARNKSSHNPK